MNIKAFLYFQIYPEQGNLLEVYSYQHIYTCTEQCCRGWLSITIPVLRIFWNTVWGEIKQWTVGKVELKSEQ